MMMNPLVFSLFLLLFLSSSITAHTSLRVRVTDRALPVVKSFGLQFLEGLLNKPFPAFKPLETNWAEIVIKEFTLTNLLMNPDQVDLRFVENLGVRFEIRDLHFTAQLRREVNLQLFGAWNFHNATTIIEGQGVSATLDVRLNRQGRQLRVQMQNCEFNANALRLNTNSILGTVVDFVLMWRRVIENQFCPAVQSKVIPKVSSMLEKLAMMNLSEEHHISMENSVSADVTVTPRSIDVPFRSVVLQGANNLSVAGTDLSRPSVITGSDLMAYVAISDSFFKSITESLHRAGPFEMPIPEVFGQGALDLPAGPAAVELTEAPKISISQRGFSVTAKASVQSLQPGNSPVSVECNAELEFSVRQTHLFPVLSPNSRKPCRLLPGNTLGNVIKGVANIFLNWNIRSLLVDGIQLPFPEGVRFTESNILNKDGYMVFGGGLALDAAVARRVAQLLTNVM